MKTVKTLSTLACVVALAVPSLATAQSVSLNIGPAGAGCGRFNPATYYCFGLPVAYANAAGKLTHGILWTDAQNNINRTGNGFVVFYDGIPISVATITSVVCKNCVNTRTAPGSGTLIETLVGRGYSGTLTIKYVTQHHTSGSGRGGGYPGDTWIALPTSSLVLTFK